MKKVILLCLGMFTLSCLHGMDSSGAGSSTPTPGKSWSDILPEDVLRHISSLIKTDKDFMNYLKTSPKRELLPENIINHYREFFKTHPNSKLLLKAIKAGKVTFAQQLASVGNFNLKKNQIGNLNLLDEENNTALTLAIKIGGTSNNDDIKGAYKELTRIIIDKKGVKLNTINKANQTAYKLARDNGWTDIVNLLKEKGANPEQGFGFDNRLIDAVRNNNDQLVQQLLGEGINPDNQDLWGFTALILAAYSNNPDMVEILLAANADPNIQNKDGSTALIVAAQRNNLDMFEALLAANADPNIQGNNGYTALHWAAYFNNLAMVKVLLTANADPNIQNKDGSTALHWAAEHNNLAMVKVLLAANADPNIQSNSGYTPLIWAAKNNNLAMVKVLLAAHADPNIQSNSGYTPLIFAAKNNNLDMANILLTANADPNIHDRNHMKAIDHGWHNNDIRTILDPITQGQIWRKYTQKRYVIPAATLASLAAYYAYKKLK